MASRRRRKRLSLNRIAVLEWSGAGLLLAGLGLIYIPAALIVAGIMAFGVSYLIRAEERQRAVTTTQPDAEPRRRHLRPTG